MRRPRPNLLASGIALAVAVLAACGADTARLSPLAWQKVSGPAGGAVLGPGDPGTFDEFGNFTEQAFEDGGRTWLYYGGIEAPTDPSCPGIQKTRWRIGLAQSTDGVTFTRVSGPYDGAVLDIGAPGDFDSFMAYRPVVLHDGAIWRMWYNGSAQPFFDCATQTLAVDRLIGYAESTDGVHWTKKNEGPGPGGSVLPLGGPGEIDEQQVGYVAVVKDGGQYRMYYSANDRLNYWRVALAVSTDGRTWTKVRGKAPNGAVLDLGQTGSLDAACAYQPTVVKEREDLWRMWYRACATPRPGPAGGPSGGTIGYAESNDGIGWVKIPQPGPNGAALGAGPAGSFDSGGLTSPSVTLDPSGWRMYYAGFDTSGRYLTGLARAPR